MIPRQSHFPTIPILQCLKQNPYLQFWVAILQMFWIFRWQFPTWIERKNLIMTKLNLQSQFHTCIEFSTTFYHQRMTAYQQPIEYTCRLMLFDSFQINGHFFIFHISFFVESNMHVEQWKLKSSYTKLMSGPFLSGSHDIETIQLRFENSKLKCTCQIERFESWPATENSDIIFKMWSGIFVLKGNSYIWHSFKFLNKLNVWWIFSKRAG